MPRFLLSCALAFALSLLAAAGARAQTIAPCGDCAKRVPCVLCNTIARCCWYESSKPADQRCIALRDGPDHWTIVPRGFVNCFVSSGADGNNQECYGQVCGGNPDPCANGGCTPGYHQTTNCQSEVPIDECGCCYDASPIVVSLRDDHYNFSSARDGVMFDINGLGKILWIAWPVSRDDAWLALDRNGNGAIDSGAELFGNVTRLRTGLAAANGYEALAEFDANNDGVIDVRDPVYSSLRLWTDRNRNGRSDPSELRTLSQARVASLSVEYRTSRRRDANGNTFRLRSEVVFTDGTRRATYDVYPAAAAVSGLTAAALGTCPQRTTAITTQPAMER